MRTFVGENEKCESLELDGGTDRGKNRTAFLLDVFHDVALLGGVGLRIFDHAGAHEDILLAEIALCQILYVEVKSEHPTTEIVHLIHAKVALRIGFEAFVVVLAVVEIGAPTRFPSLHERRFGYVVRRVRRTADGAQFHSHAPVATHVVCAE